MKTIQLTKGYETVVDDEFYSDLSLFPWHADIAPNGTNVYAKHSFLGKMHRYIVGVLMKIDINGKIVDHIDGNGLNNLKENFRVVESKRENSRNRKDRKKSIHSKYVGVTYRSHAGRWCAKTQVDYKSIFLGYYNTEEEAAMAYDRGVLYYFPDENTVLNFPERKHEHDLSSPYEKSYKKTKTTNTSGYRGVYATKNGKFSVSINFGGRQGKKLSLGTYKDIMQAAFVYDVARLVVDELNGEKTIEEYLNLPDLVVSDVFYNEMKNLILSKI